MPHHRAEPNELACWKHPSPYQQGASHAQVFAVGTWGGEWHPDFQPEAGDVIVKEHWGGSGFANTDLEYLLKQHGIDRVVIVGMLANTCIEPLENSLPSWVTTSPWCETPPRRSAPKRCTPPMRSTGRRMPIRLSRQQSGSQCWGELLR